MALLCFYPLPANIYMQHTRLLVDQFQVNSATRPGRVLMQDDSVERARTLGQNVAKAMMMPIEDVTYVGDERGTACPVCHCDVLQVPEKFPNVVCPVCDVHGVLTGEGENMKVVWNEETPCRLLLAITVCILYNMLTIFAGFF